MNETVEIRIQILFFARARELAGCSSRTLQLTRGTTLADLRTRLAADLPALKGYLRHCRLSINEEFRNWDSAIPADAKVAIIPPVSGGGSQRSSEKPEWRFS